MNFPPPSPRQARVIWFCLTTLVAAAVVGLVGLVLWAAGLVVRLLSPVLLPLALAGIAAYLLDPVVDFFQRRGIPRLRGIFLVFFMAVMFALTLFTTVAPALFVQVEKLVQDMPSDLQKLQERVDEWIASSPVGQRVAVIWRQRSRPPGSAGQSAPEPTGVPAVSAGPGSAVTNASDRIAAPGAPQTGTDPANRGLDASSLLESVTQWLAQKARAVLSWNWIATQLGKVASWAGLIAGLALVPVYVFYFLLEKHGINRHWTDYLPIAESRVKEELVFVLNAINDCLIVFFRGQVLVAICVGTLLALGYALVGLKYALLLGLVAGVLGIIPYLGAIMSLIPALIIAVVQFGTWWHPLLVLGVYAVVQMAEGLFISPKIIGDRVGLHPLTVIVAVLLGTTLLGGVIGGVLAIPLTAAVRTLMFRYVWKRTT